MDNNNIFERAIRMKIRYETSKGSLTMEDLWDLPLTSERGVSLDQIAIGLNKKVKETSTESFVNRPPKANDTVVIAFEVVKSIIDTRLAENAITLAKAEAKQKKDRILTLIAEKQDEQLKGKSLEELTALAQSL